MLLQYILTKVVLYIPQYRVNVIRVVLGIVVFDPDRWTVNPVVVLLVPIRLTRPCES